jgi:protein-S-isoprenylcysteine O-methyltransferase Ste14
MTAWRHARAIALLPGTVTIVLPAAILLVGDGPEIGWGIGGAGAVLVAIAGGALIAAGLGLWAWTVWLFARRGEGTLAPWDATRRLVVVGPYRHVRNPMITAVVAVLAGEAAVLGSLGILIWAGAFLVLNHLFFVLVEEPGLERRFGDEYREYKRAVPRWIPQPAGPGPSGRRR